MKTAAPKPSKKPLTSSNARINDPERIKEDILEIATHAFARDGLSGSRINDIGGLTAASKRMIYYYFESKEGLYRAVLERCYADIRSREEAIGVEGLPPEEALAQLVRLKFTYHLEHPEFVRLVMVENIHQGEHMGYLKEAKTRGMFALQQLTRILERGAAVGVFRNAIQPIDVHTSISALCFYNVSNRWTVSHLLEHDMGETNNADKRREAVVDEILRLCRS
jgi:AcrR family transcriptional regulator